VAIYRHAPLSAVAANALFTAGACGVPPAEQLHGTTGQSFRIAEQRDGLTTIWDDLERPIERFLQLFIHTPARSYTIRECQEPKVRQINGETTNIQTGWYVRSPEKKRRSRDPERTRKRLLQAGYREIYRSGFQSASIDTILAATNVTKGALYHHFESKEALGYAIVEEVVATLPRDRWILPLQRSKDKDSIDALIGVVRAIPTRPRDIKGGCPLVNLAQEMSQLDEQFASDWRDPG
jgi:hypothetical protein